MSVCHRVFHAVAQAGLAFALQSGAISSATAIEMMEQIRAAGRYHKAPDTVITYCILDFELAMDNLETSGIDHLADQFEEQLVFNELTDPETTI